MILLKQKGVELGSNLSGTLYKEFKNDDVESCFDEIRLEFENAGILPLEDALIERRRDEDHGKYN